MSLPFARSFAQYFIGTQEGAGKMYPWLHQQAIDEGFRNLTTADHGTTSCEFMSLTRSTFVGGQRFCSYLWSGDTESRFDVLLQQITVGTSVAASGISAWTLDIGGFSGLNVDTDSVRFAFIIPPLHHPYCLGPRAVCSMAIHGRLSAIRERLLLLMNYLDMNKTSPQMRVHGHVYPFLTLNLFR